MGFVGHEGKVLIVLLRWRSAHAENLRTTLTAGWLLHVLHIRTSRDYVPVTDVTREEIRRSLP